MLQICNSNRELQGRHWQACSLRMSIISIEFCLEIINIETIIQQCARCPDVCMVMQQS